MRLTTIALVILALVCSFGICRAEEAPAAPAASAAPEKAPEAAATPAAPASPAAVEAKKEFVCEKCSVTKDAAGKCEKCGADLAEKVAQPKVEEPKKDEPKKDEPKKEEEKK